MKGKSPVFIPMKWNRNLSHRVIELKPSGIKRECKLKEKMQVTEIQKK